MFQSEVACTEPGEALTLVAASLGDVDRIEGQSTPGVEEMVFAGALVGGVKEHQAEIDEFIETCSINWRVNRMPIVDRNILRLAAFELMHRDDIPGNVSVNEAVELAKKFGSEHSRAFVNGIVDRMGHRLNKLSRSEK